MAESAYYLVGCKLPHGLSFPDHQQWVTLAGANASKLVNGFGITKVPAVTWKTFLKNYQDAEFIKKGLVFAVNNENDFQDASQERLTQKTGLEQANKATADVQEDQEE